MSKSNERCVCSFKLGYGCEALVEEDDGCLDGTCPFYKTEKQQKESEEKARERCEALGYTFKSRDQVVDEMNYRSKYDKRHRQKERDGGVLQYSTLENEYYQHDSIEACSKALGIPVDKLKLLIRKQEEYKGYRYMML